MTITETCTQKQLRKTIKVYKADKHREKEDNTELYEVRRLGKQRHTRQTCNSQPKETIQTEIWTSFKGNIVTLYTKTDTRDYTG